MSDDRQAKKLAQVRALLAKADSTEFEGEAEVFRQKADELMTAYAIEQWQVAQDDGGGRPTPETRHVDIDWWYTTRDYDTASELWWMWNAVAKHCRCVIALRGMGSGGRRTCPVIGLPSDLDWCDALFTNLMLQLSKHLEVKPDSGKPLAENVYAMRMAGMGWMRITELLWSAGLVDPPRKPVKLGEQYDYDLREYVNRTYEVQGADEWAEIPEQAREVIKNRLAQLNRKYARDHGLERNYVRPEVYQRSFTDGFCTEVGSRLRTMRREREGAYDATHEAGSMALVVQDIRQQALDLYNQLFPPPEPDPNAKKSRSTAMVRELAKDYGAMGAGRREGARANLSNNPSERIGSRKELDS